MSSPAISNVIGVCVKWLSVAPHYVTDVPSVVDTRFAGFSPSDEAALELALQRGATTGAKVRLVSIAPVAARQHLVALGACGADEIVHIEYDGDMASADVAKTLALFIADCQTIWCGDYSLDRGSGSVPAFLGAQLRRQQGLGIVEIDPLTNPLRATRRLDSGRREVLELNEPAIISVEGSVASLRRAGLAATLRPAALINTITPAVVAGTVVGDFRPYRPRPRNADAPVGTTPLERIKSITANGAAHSRGDIVELDPESGAKRIVDTLVEWGYLA